MAHPIAPAVDPTVATLDHAFFGHPRGLSTLFFTEMWERFSYYGMRALLILFMTDSARRGARDEQSAAGALYGLYTFGVYCAGAAGRMDRRSARRPAACCSLWRHPDRTRPLTAWRISSVATFYAGLVLIVFGTGLLKPNVSAIVGDLYTEKGAQRDAGFSIFYMGINLGAFLGPLVCSWLGEPREGADWVNWHYGFARRRRRDDARPHSVRRRPAVSRAAPASSRTTRRGPSGSRSHGGSSPSA